jgi:LmbE family N-acetylglucosaminyl deacetylase
MMIFKNSGAEIFVPDGIPIDEAVCRTTQMAISAHQDDIEMMALDGILKCFGKDDEWFFAVVVANGAGSPGYDLYSGYTDEQMLKVRKLEQKKAAFIGEYGAAALLNYPSSIVKDRKEHDIIDELKNLISVAKPKVIYTHNLADKHDTHIGVVTKVIKALRELPKVLLPEKVYGCEVWRSLDWVNDDEKVAFDVSRHANIASALVEVFDSQICSGKGYDLAATGRRLANATYFTARGADKASALVYAMDLTPLINDINLDIIEFVSRYVERFKMDVTDRIRKMV